MISELLAIVPNPFTKFAKLKVNLMFYTLYAVFGNTIFKVFLKLGGEKKGHEPRSGNKI